MNGERIASFLRHCAKYSLITAGLVALYLVSTTALLAVWIGLCCLLTAELSARYRVRQRGGQPVSSFDLQLAANFKAWRRRCRGGEGR